jgi:hypothetical protein
LPFALELLLQDVAPTEELSMAKSIRSIFINPPIAVARLGGSNTPQDAYIWAQSPDPRQDGETTIVPTWSLNVQPDATVEPKLPTELIFRDNTLIRPVAPFFELWALMGEAESEPETWQAVALTPDLLTRFGADVSAITVQVDAHNLKAARRTGNPAHDFGTFPPVTIRGDDNQPAVLFAVNPPGTKRPMIPSGRNIPLGSVQILKSRANVPGAPWNDFVNLEVIRLRFTPGRGRFYGPPDAAKTTSRRPFPAVEAANAFLDPKAGWFNARVLGLDSPADTYDGAEQPAPANEDGRPLGIVDDTCEARIEITLKLPRARTALKAAASVFVGPPDFAPDRRPFLSLADEINDRSADAANRSKGMSAADRDAWVEDLFARVYETLSLFNLDYYREGRSVRLKGDELALMLDGDGLPKPEFAMGGRDGLRNEYYRVAAASRDEPLPLSHHARRQHRAIVALQNLKDFIALNPGRLESLVRVPFEWRSSEISDDPNVTTMRMPPFMRQSNAGPLSLSVWQYQLLMDWVGKLPAGVAAAAVAAAPAVAPLSDEAEARRTAVLARIKGGGGGRP